VYKVAGMNWIISDRLVAVASKKHRRRSVVESEGKNFSHASFSVFSLLLTARNKPVIFFESLASLSMIDKQRAKKYNNDKKSTGRNTYSLGACNFLQWR
jgi:hypothetical protein|tara:strand:- start:252 stop:548 length:297 start_codon:yes stop_codon:yes gene_type:complete